jgi:hypothetical protein
MPQNGFAAMRGLLGVANDKTQYEQNRSALRSFAGMQADNDFRRSGPIPELDNHDGVH